MVCLEFPVLPMNPVPVIPRSFLFIVFIWLSQLFPDNMLPSDLACCLLGVPNYDHVHVMLDALWVH